MVKAKMLKDSFMLCHTTAKPKFATVLYLLLFFFIMPHLYTFFCYFFYRVACDSTCLVVKINEYYLTVLVSKG